MKELSFSTSLLLSNRTRYIQSIWIHSLRCTTSIVLSMPIMLRLNVAKDFSLQELGREFLKALKVIPTRLSASSLSPFTVALAMSVVRIHRFEDAVSTTSWRSVHLYLPGIYIYRCLIASRVPF